MWVDGEGKAARQVLPTRASLQLRTPEQEADGAWRDWAWTASQAGAREAVGCLPA